MPYQPIESYGIIGDMHTVALIGLNGSIDWMCVPRFDSPSVFGAILDHERGGHFRIWPEGEDATHKQFYWPGTNVLVTRCFAEHGAAELTDFMPVVDEEASESASRRQSDGSRRRAARSRCAWSAGRPSTTRARSTRSSG